MQENLSRFDTLKLATQYWHGDETTTILIVVLFFLAIVLFFIIGTILQKRLKEKNIQHYFDIYAKERELNEREKETLWKYAHKMERDPMLVLEFKAPFEKVMDLYIKTDPHPDEELVRSLRKKLDFEVVSPYIPLITTKDIEVFQNGRMILSNNKALDVALYDKDEKYMYWLVIDGDLPLSTHPGEYVKIVFIRQDDGIYSFEQPIAEILKESGKTIIKIPHTFELSRTQRRETPRIKIDIPLNFIIYTNDEQNVFEGRFVDISAGGAKFCAKNDNDILKKVKFGDNIELIFNLDKHTYNLSSKVLEIDRRPKSICFRTLFDNVDKEIKEQILEFVLKEQLKHAQLKRKRQ
ncbi:hypothetical protein NitYY0826_C0742 [Nitratiruptor sp. YY08-26]|uniref:flagellar brake protein n=1 Tax=unclassified Nitratiruptor TaxID=2624044 RepID=UPI001915DDFA|nr:MULTISPECIES: PilZ domain-containing protein [unclassified Nitratiruptor]BCD61879.1 hypothetical protein NitYY0813_C0740 [Nitratiruptor sp. YY08-13]BCD65814.1 hypothetical protein NitYY0826_C0742 [Nitratiruptor sp. YY08-26]